MAGVGGDFLDALTRLNVNRSGGRASPHKPVLLLAILDLAVAGRLRENRIRLDPALLTRYRAYWEVAAVAGDQPNPFLPYFHMRKEPFWTLHALPGREAVLAAMKRIGSIAEVRANIDFASLDGRSWQRLQDPVYANEAARVLIGHWFGDRYDAVLRVWEENREIARYELALDRDDAGLPQRDGEAAYVPARDAAFRRLVLDAYDYRCAASGWRFILDDWFLVEAAHIVPFSESRNDSPRNGLALSPTFHRLMDRHVIAPGPDYKWRVSGAVDRRIRDNQELLAIEGTELILPADRRRWPDPGCLDWRLQRLV